MIQDQDLSRFRAAIAQRLGLQFDRDKADSLSDVLRERIGTAGAAAYLARLESPEGADELKLLAERLTVSETFFFRNVDQFRALTGAVLPELLKAKREIRILSAGCASGDEPYSLAILIREQGSDASVAVHGIDVSGSMIRKAVRAGYSSWALRDTSKEIIETAKSSRSRRRFGGA